MHLIVGLGNPGKKYLFTRHNIGFIAIDVFKEPDSPSEKAEQKAFTYKMNVHGHDVLLVKPQTFMNVSGESVQGLMAYYKIELENILVVHDDADLPYGTIRFQKDASPGGHNGIKSIHALLGTDKYTRLKLGVGRPEVLSEKTRQDTADYLLQSFSNEDKEHLEDYMIRAALAIETFIVEGYEIASSKHNKRVNYRDAQNEPGEL